MVSPKSHLAHANNMALSSSHGPSHNATDLNQASTRTSNARLQDDLAGERQHVDARGRTTGGTPASDEISMEVPSKEGNGGSSHRNQVSYMGIPNAFRLVATELQVQATETGLHKAVRQRDSDAVFNLRYDRILAQTPNSNGMPPLYLAVHLGYDDMANKLIETFGRHLSPEGPKGQNVLHVATLRSEDLWNQADEVGCKPIHLAASVGVKGVTGLLLSQVVMRDADSTGMCPIHIAASVGAMDAIHALVGENECVSSTLRDAKGGTFLHVAVENKRTHVVKYICTKPGLEGILNMKNKDGNTALHLAVEKRDESIFGYLLGNGLVELNHVNNDGYTPLDLASMIKIQNSYASRQNPTEWMIRALAHSGAHFSARKRSSTSKTVKNHQLDLAASIESVLVASALIATLTFAAAFTMPGSYKTEGHPKAGTPALGGHYGFKVFLVADILAFFCSVAATYSLAEYGSRGDPLVRCIYARRAIRFFHVALKSVIVAFTLGVSVVMWDISVITIIIVVVAASCLVLYGNEALAHDFRLMWVMYRRFGLSLSWTLYPSTSYQLDWNTWRLRSFSATLAWNIIKLFSTYIFIFVIAYIAQLKQKGGN